MNALGDDFPAPAIATVATEAPARLIVSAPRGDALARGLLVVQYRTEHLRIVEAYGPVARAVLPRIGHLHITIDDLPWHWVDASGQPLIVQGLAPGPHRIRIDLADPTHAVIDTATIEFTIPSRSSHPTSAEEHTP